MHAVLSEEQLEAFTQELDAAIEALDQQYGTVRVGRGEPLTSLLPAAQRTALEHATGETVNSFWLKLKRAAHEDICEKGGFIHDQWENYATIASKDLVKVSAGILTGLGISGGSFLIGVVPVALWIFTALTSIGLQAFCEAD